MLVIRGAEEDCVLPPLRSDLYAVPLSLGLPRSPNEDRAGPRYYHVRLPIRSVLCHASGSPRTLYPEQKGCFLFLRDKNSHFLRLASYSRMALNLEFLTITPFSSTGVCGYWPVHLGFPFLPPLCPPFPSFFLSHLPFIFCIARDQIQGHVHIG